VQTIGVLWLLSPLVEKVKENHIIAKSKEPHESGSLQNKALLFIKIQALGTP
jgi:hypothetical protein